MNSPDHDPRTIAAPIPEVGPWGAVTAARPVGERVWHVTAAGGEGLVVEAGEAYEIDPPLQPPGPVTDTGGRELRWVSEGVGADTVRLNYSAWGRMTLSAAERERLARSIALRAPAEWMMTLRIRRRAMPDPARRPVGGSGRRLGRGMGSGRHGGKLRTCPRLARRSVGAVGRAASRIGPRRARAHRASAAR